MTLPSRKFRSSKQQPNFFLEGPKRHGGSLALGKRKKSRPIDIRKPLHIVYRSLKAKGHLALVKHERKIVRILTKMAKKFRISIYERNVNFDHIHLLIYGKRKKNIQNFFRATAGLIARAVTSSEKSNPYGKFWSYLVFSRVVSWKGDFENVRNYIVQNSLETHGHIPYQTRKKNYSNTS